VTTDSERQTNDLPWMAAYVIFETGLGRSRGVAGTMAANGSGLQLSTA
jgi:hypothetical protein